MIDPHIRWCSLSCAYIAVENGNGEHSIGACYHIGDGYYVTAKHVIEEKNILEVSPYNSTYLLKEELLQPDQIKRPLSLMSGKYPIYHLSHKDIKICAGPFLHPNAEIDVAIFRLEGIDTNTPFLELPPFLDEAIGALDFVLAEPIILGYPPVAFSQRPDLIIATAEINAVCDTRLDRFVRFILSANPRGGFSGGPAVLQNRFNIGLITQDLKIKNSNDESGFMAVLSADAIVECMNHYGIKIAAQIFE